MNTLRYLWAHPYGRLALLMIAVGAVGLTLHYWAGFLLVAGLRLPRFAPGSAPTVGVTRKSRDAQMVGQWLT